MEALKDTSLPAAEPWDQVRRLKPRLKLDCNVYRHKYRGNNSYVIKDTLTSAHFRLAEPAWQLLFKLDGQVTLDSAYSALSAEQQAQLPREEVIRLLAGLQEANLLTSATPPAALEPGAGPGISRANADKPLPGARQGWREKLKRPFMIKLPLWNPDRTLERLLPFARPLLLNRLLLLAGLLALVWAVLQVVRQWSGLQQHWQSRFVDPQNLLWLWLLYPLIKLVHEFAHGIAVKLRGGRVQEMGVMLLLLMPIPYVDASASTIFTKKSERLWVAAAGVVAELLLAVLALAIWLAAGPGLVKDLAFNTLFIGAASTLLFNGNPLLRFDGYYVLCDWLEMPNLGTRAQQYLGYLSQRYVFGLQGAAAPMALAQEKPWLLAYGCLSWLYRLLLGVTIALFLAAKFFLLGILLAFWFLLLQLLLPLLRSLRSLVLAARAEQRLSGVVLRGAGLLALAWLALFGVPITQSTSVYGVVQLPEGTEVRSDSAGFVGALLVAPGARVAAGVPLLQLHNDELRRDHAVLQARRQELQAKYRQASATSTADAAIIIGQLQAVDQQLRDAQTQIDKLQILSPRQGLVQLPAAADLRGRYIDKGRVLGYVTSDAQLRARVAVNQWDMQRVKEQSAAVQVRLVSDPGKIIAAQLVQSVPSATRELPSVLLGSQGGGSLQVDARDSRGLTLLRSVFVFDVQFTAPPGLNLLGSRVLVRFLYSRRSIASHLALRIKQWQLDSPFWKYGLD